MQRTRTLTAAVPCPTGYFNPITRDAQRVMDEAILGKLERRENSWPA